MWNPQMELLFLEQTIGFVASYLVEIDVAKIALSCHFALDLLCCKEVVLASTWWYTGHHCPMEFLFLWLRCHTRIVVLGASLQLSSPRFFAFSLVFSSLVYFRVLPSVTRAALCVPSAWVRPQVFLIFDTAASVKRLDTVMGKGNVPSWCFIVLRHVVTRTGCVYFSSAPQIRRRSLPTLPQTHFSRSRRLGSCSHAIVPLRLFLFPGALKCCCGTIVTTFSQDSGRDSQDLCCFSLVDAPSRWRRQLHVVRAISYEWPSLLLLAKWRNLPGGGHRAFTLLGSNFWFALKESCSPHFSVLLSCERVVYSMFPSFRPDTASIRSSLSLPPGFLNTREAGTCAGSRAWSSFFLLDKYRLFRIDELPQDCFVVSCLFMRILFIMQPLHLLKRCFVPWQVGSANGSPFGFQLATRFRRLTSKNGYVLVLYLLKDPAPQIRVMSSLRLLGCRSLLIRHLGNQPIPWTKHAFGNVLRHHCLRCWHDLNVIWLIRNNSVLSRTP